MGKPSLFAALFLISAVGCAAPAQPPAPAIDLAAERAALMQADRDWFAAYSASDNRPDTFVSLFVDDAYLLPPEAPLAHDKAAIRSLIAELEGMPGFAVTWAPSVAEVSGEADLGYTIGSHHMQMEDADGAPVGVDGKYLTMWKKQADGSWKVAADMFNADAPPMPPED